MNGQTLEQLWCKLTASNDWVSQLACYANFEQQHPTGAVPTGPLVDPKLGMSDSSILWLLAAFVFLAWMVRTYSRPGGLIGSWNPKRKPAPPRIEPRL